MEDAVELPDCWQQAALAASVRTPLARLAGPPRQVRGEE